MSELIDTTEMYLKTVYELEEDGVTPLRARIVERLEHSGPTVSQTVARMERDGLIRVAPDRSLHLTEAGRARATEVIRKHRLAERLLLDVVGLDRRLVHEEACRWEHVMGEQVEERLAVILADVSRDPFGNPIPGRHATHPEPAVGELSASCLTDGVAEGVEQGATVTRVGEPLQADAELISALEDAEVRPGASVRLWGVRHGIRVVGPTGGVVTLGGDFSRHLFLAG